MTTPPPPTPAAPATKKKADGTDVFESLALVGGMFRFAETIEDRRRAFMYLPSAVRRAIWFTGELRARIDVELADYVRHADAVLRDQLESVAVALGKGVIEGAATKEETETLRTLESMLIEGLEAADALVSR